MPGNHFAAPRGRRIGRCGAWAAAAVLAWGGGAGPGAAAGTTVFAAASLAAPIEEISRRYRERTGARVVASYQSSGILARQIAHGAPADVFVSADEAWIGRLAADGHLRRSETRAFAGNRLVLAAPAGAALPAGVTLAEALTARLGSGPLAIGDPDHVPAGAYAKAALAALGLWEGLRRKCARAANARAALALVERGAAPFGIVYATDARASARVRVAAAVPETAHPPVVYWAGMLPGARGGPARAYFSHLFSAEASAILRRHGFSPPP